MPSDSKKKEQQRKKDAAKKRQTGAPVKKEEKTENGTAEKVELTEEEKLCLKLEEEARINSEAR